MLRFLRSKRTCLKSHVEEYWRVTSSSLKKYLTSPKSVEFTNSQLEIYIYIYIHIYIYIYIYISFEKGTFCSVYVLASLLVVF